MFISIFIKKIINDENLLAGLLVRDELLDGAGVALGDVRSAAQIALGLAGLLVEDVALVSLGALDEASLGHGKTLGGAAMSFLLRHKGNPPLRVFILSEPVWLLCWGPSAPGS